MLGGLLLRPERKQFLAGERIQRAASLPCGRFHCAKTADKFFAGGVEGLLAVQPQKTPRLHCGEEQIAQMKEDLAVQNAITFLVKEAALTE